MTSELRLAAVLFASLLLWSPALTAFIAGELEAGAAGARYGASLALAWLAVTALGAVVSGYRAEPATEAGDRGAPAVGRRADDPAAPVPEDGPATAEADPAP